MGRVKAGSLRLGEAGELLELSYRQTKRIWARFRGGGAKGLQHRNCGRRSNRAYAAAFRNQIRGCGGCRSATAISVRRWRASTWAATTGSSCMARRGQAAFSV